MRGPLGSSEAEQGLLRGGIAETQCQVWVGSVSARSKSRLAGIRQKPEPIASQFPIGPASDESGGLKDRHGAWEGAGAKSSGVLGTGPQGIEPACGDGRRDKRHGG
jgi:hypothetical protein